MLSRGQFSDYRFDVGRDSQGATVATATHLASGEVRSAISIQDGNADNNRAQRNINHYGGDHHPVADYNGQMRWTQGNMDRQPHPDKVQWAGDTSRDPKIVRAVMGLALQEHGRMPVADNELTPEGSKLSRAMGKKFGIQGHPDNPDMNPTLNSVGPRVGHDEVTGEIWDAENAARGRDHATQRNNKMYRMDMANTRRSRGQARYSEADATQAARAESLSTRMPKPRIQKSQQGRLF